MMLKISHHCKEDRVDRLMTIMENIGIGEIVVEFPSSNYLGSIIHAITDTGVLLVLSPTDRTLITAFMCTIERANAIYRNNLNTNPPPFLINKITKNLQRKKFLFT